MKIDRAIRLKADMVSRYSSLASRAVFYGMTHDSYCDELKEIRAHLDKVKAPRWLTSYLSGYADRTREQWYRDSIVWAHKDPETGILYVAHKDGLPAPFNHKVEEFYNRGEGARIAIWKSGAHYWIDASIRAHSHGQPLKAL